MSYGLFWFRGRAAFADRDLLVREYRIEDGRRVLRASSGDLPDLMLDADNETMVLGVAVLAGDGV